MNFRKSKFLCFLNFQWDTCRKSASGPRFSESPRKMMQMDAILIEIRCVRDHFVTFRCFPARKARNRPRDNDFRNLREKWCRIPGFSSKSVAWGVVSWRLSVWVVLGGLQRPLNAPSVAKVPGYTGGGGAALHVPWGLSGWKTAKRHEITPQATDFDENP